VKTNSTNSRAPRRKFRLSRRRIIVISMSIVVAVAFSILFYYCHRFSKMIDARLSGEVIHSGSRIYSAPKRITVGEAITLGRLARYLKNAGYSGTENAEAAGRMVLTDASIDIKPSANSYFAGKNAISVLFADQRISQLRSLDSGNRLISAEIEPEWITGLFGSNREKRQPVSYEKLPKTLIDAVLSAEDKRFFDHPGFDPIRIFGAAWADLRRGAKAQGASTITMQTARSFFFSTKRTWDRKLKETLMALVLEHRFNKQRIFELYANEVYLGNRGSFAIHGFGEASQAYFRKNLQDLNLAQICFLAGIIRAPNRYTSAERKPERAADARDRILSQMVTNKYISQKQAKEASAMPLNLVSGTLGASPAGHFVDMIIDDLLDKFSEEELIAQNYRIYTTLDTELQRAATSAVELGLQNVDALLAKTYARWRKRGEAVPLPQAALIALNPQTGEIKALVGGRDYAISQLNHVLASRQPGSAFKPFVYAAAFENALEGVEPILTPLSTVVDEATTFSYDGREYAPHNYGHEFHGIVTLRDALIHSLNVPTVKVAEQIGYEHVVQLAKRLGLQSDIKPTPAVALGAYELTPIEVAAGYTAFANYGIRSEPVSLQRVVAPDGTLVKNNVFSRRTVLDARIAYMVTNVLEDVLRRGTGAGVRTRGFYAPAAGKTGTSRDGWFVGYTTNLLCVVWVGFDDNRELELAGSSSAGPIWAEFMKKAVMLPAFENTQEFERPEGVVSIPIDPETRMLAVPECPVTRQEVFIAGTGPTVPCTQHAKPGATAPKIAR
jgi:penicillin-binding protein 1B